MAKLRHIEETLDTTTGEVKTITKTFSVKSKTKEDFFILFLTGLNAICSLSRPSDIKILAIFCSKAEFNTGKVRLTATDRKEIMDKLKIKPQSFSNSLKRLKDNGLLEGSRGAYEINPQCFWKGTTDERNRLLRERSADLLLKFRDE